MKESTKARPTLDVSHLPPYVFGHRSLLWWGTLGMIVIEGPIFVLLIVTYFYLRDRVSTWPPNLPPPELFYGTLNTLILLASAIPNQWVKKRAEQEDLRAVRIGLLVCLAFAAGFLTVRVFEFGALNCSWDTNAYGSVVWTLMGFHTVHMATDVADTIVLTVMLFTGPLEGRRFVDVSENSFYWYFVVLIWLPIYAVVYLVPRWL